MAVSSSESGENTWNAKSILSGYHYTEKTALKEDMENGYVAVTKG